MAKNNDFKILSVRFNKQLDSENNLVNEVEKIIQKVDCSTSDLIKNALAFYIKNHQVKEVIIRKNEIVRLSA